ncbi:RsiW-degrading membrane proteinase PrsW (M82 family) [Streptosporangium album]|uniref:RsiW-degrading membrane proteinase PrsW (M82 family) n=1 Tax=Streptosporangium album TaxID=47479 RepID=A0A7W7WCW6_9ACTN|nr:PrsW family intramembrane metalloprotease [Streptosporangium album]MBB4942223.1 RsiW-degrading membrane proteinase PrsW (M82 family) [Streptosporangium album]
MASRDPRWVFKDRPSVALISGLVLTGICALASFSFDVLNGDPVYFFIALALALAPVPVLLAAVLALDRMEPEPRSNLIFAFAWGAGVAVLVAGLVNSFNLIYIENTVRLGYDTARNIAATFGAPVVEETMKGLVLLGLLRFKRAELDGPTDGIIYASMVGLGFAMSENVSYYVAALDDMGARGLAVTVVLRGFLSPFAHPLFTSMIGVAVAYAAQRRGPMRILVIAAGWIGAMLLHGIWNGFASYAGIGGLAVAYLLLMIVLFVLIGIVFRDRRRIVGLIQTFLPAYQATGLVTPYDVTMLSSLPGRRQARQWARKNGGRGGLRAMNDYQLAATELGLLHERARRQMIGERTFDEEQHALLTCMADARAHFPAAAFQGAPPAA